MIDDETLDLASARGTSRLKPVPSSSGNRSAMKRFVPLCVLVIALTGNLLGEDAFHPVRCEGKYPMHLQGVSTNDRDAIYWSFTDRLVKTDREGKILVNVPADDHQGDPCFRNGKLYVAVNLGEFNQPEGKADSWVYVFDGVDLKLLAKHPVPEVVHGAGGIAVQESKFIVVGGLPGDLSENYLYEYDETFRFRKRHVLPSGQTHLGIQTAEYADGFWWFGCYGTPRVLLKADQDFQLVGKWEFDCSLGITRTPEGTLLIARGKQSPEKLYDGELVRALPDDQTGLRIVP